MRRVVIGGLLVVLCVLGWYLDGLLTTSAWVSGFDAVDNSGQITSGWGILRAAWPLALVGVLVGGTLALVGMLMVYSWADDADHANEIERLRHAAIEAEDRAEQADTRAKAEAAAAVQALQADAAQSIQLAESRRQAATRAIAEVDQRVALMTQERDEAKRKAANATATIRRHQAKAVAK